MHEAILLTRVASKNFKESFKAFLSYFSHEFTEKFQSLYLNIFFFIIVKHLPVFVHLVFNIGTLKIFHSLENFSC